MVGNNEIFIVVKSIANTASAISELDDCIMRETNDLCINKLKERRNQLIDILEQLATDLKNRSKHN
jgi:hypothetical protein